MLKMMNYDSSFPNNNLQRPSFNSSNMQTDYRYKPPSPVQSGSMSNLNQVSLNEKRFIHANNKYPSPRVPIQQSAGKTTESFQSESKTLLNKSVKQMKPLSFSETKLNDPEAYNKNYYQSKEQTVKSVSLSEKKHHGSHSNSHDVHNPDHNKDHHASSEPKASKPKINKNYLTKMKRKHKNRISANVSGTKFEIVRSVLEAMGCKILPDENFDCNVIWDDTKVSVENISELKSFQRYNHFVAMSEISRKDALARNMSKMYKVMPQEFDFVPKTWLMPSEYTNLASYAVEMKKLQQKRTYIMKPANGAMGHGIKLFKNIDKIIPSDNYIIQEYISNPYLLDDYKFDLRIYALVTSCDPLRAFIFNNGLVRLGTEKYQEPNESNIDHLYMHLTNYSVNKRSKNYDEGDINGESGTKRSLKYLFDHFARRNIDSSKVWKSIQDIILKTLLVAEPYLFHTYKMCRPGQLPGTESVCFEILGFDILLDDKLKPWVLEVNRCPSFGANQQIDFDIKSRLLSDSFDLLHLRASDRTRSQKMEKSESKRRLYNLDTHTHPHKRSDASSVSINSSSSNNISNLSTNNSTNMKRFKTKEKRKQELIDQIKLLRREQRRQDYENRNLGNFSRLFPIDDKYDMDYYLNILSTAFNLFYPIGKHVQWRKNYERIKEEELLEELAECDDRVFNVYDKIDQTRIINEYIKDEYFSSESSDESSNDSEGDENRHVFNHHSNTDRSADFRLATNAIYNNNSKRYMSDSRLERHKTLIENSIDFNNYRGNDDNLSEENMRTERSDSDRNSLTIDRTQPKVSTASLLNHESVRSNRINTLMNAVSNSSTYPLLGNKKSHTFLSTHSSFKHSTKGIGQQKNSISNVEQETLDNLAQDDTNQDVLTANMELNAQANLLKQIDQHQAKQQKSKPKHSLSKQSVNENHIKNNIHSVSNKEVDDEISNNNSNHLTVAVLKLLHQLEIKFPGKSNDQTRSLLQKIYYKLESYKPKLGNYWMVKLDDAKRVKILNIVKSNLIVILQKVYLVNSVENVRLYKIFVKLLNRMLWMHGQGLWNCFSSTNSSNWESIFSKSSFNITENELKCCHRIIELCKDCVLIVYQYAFEQKPNTESSQQQQQQQQQQQLTPKQDYTNGFYKMKTGSASTTNLSIKSKV